MTTQRAYEDGYRAFGFRIDGKANPFMAGTDCHKAWRCGWLDAMQAARR